MNENEEISFTAEAQNSFNVVLLCCFYFFSSLQIFVLCFYVHIFGILCVRFWFICFAERKLCVTFRNIQILLKIIIAEDNLLKHFDKMMAPVCMQNCIQ